MKKYIIPILLAVMLSSCGSTSQPAEITTTAATTTETTTAETTTTAESTVSETTTETSTEESAPPIVLVAGEKNEYSETITFNKDTEFEDMRIVYFLPEGKFKVVNTSPKMTQVSIYKDEYFVNDDGWEEPVSDTRPIMLDSGEEAEIEIDKEHYIYISKPTVIELTPIE